VDTPDELVEAVATAVPFSLREMAAVEAVVRGTRPATEADQTADVSAVVQLSASGCRWRLVMSFPKQTAAALAQRILAGTVDEVPADMVGDCMGEVANVVAGQAKGLLVGSPSHFTLSTPSVRTGGPVEVASGLWVIQFDSDVGEFTVHLGPPA
jgi:CheY-specific phosphatase CheX